MATVTILASNYTNNNFTFNASYPVTNAYTNTSSTNYAHFIAANKVTGTLYLTGYDFSSIPSNATINSVTIKVRCMVSSTSNITAASVQACKGTTTVGTATTFRSSSATTYTLSAGTWSRSDLNNLQLKFVGTSARNNAYLRVYGTEVIVDYTESAGQTEQLMLKVNGTWTPVQTIYKKINGTWVEQTDLANLFNTETNYYKGN